jgi:hypothetical protein
LLHPWGFELQTSGTRAQRSTNCTIVSHGILLPKYWLEATERSVKCYEKILGEKDSMEKAVKYYGKVRREKRFFGKTCEKTRKYSNQNFPSNYKEIKYY